MHRMWLWLSVVSLVVMSSTVAVAEEEGDDTLAYERQEAVVESSDDESMSSWSLVGPQAGTAMVLSTVSAGSGLGLMAWTDNQTSGAGLSALALLPVWAFSYALGGMAIISGPALASGGVSWLGRGSEIERAYVFSTLGGGLIGGIVGGLGAFQLNETLQPNWDDRPWLSGLVVGLPLAAGTTIGSVGAYHWRHGVSQRRLDEDFRAPPAYDGAVLARQAGVGVSAAAATFGAAVAAAYFADDNLRGVSELGAALSSVIAVPMAVNITGNRAQYHPQYLGGFIGSWLGALVVPTLLPSMGGRGGRGGGAGIELAAFVGGSIAGSIAGYHLQASSRHGDSADEQRDDDGADGDAEANGGAPVVAPRVDDAGRHDGWTVGWQRQF